MDRTLIPPETAAHQIQAFNEAWARKFQEAINDRDLLQWCVEAALKTYVGGDLIAIAKEIHEFVTKPLRKTDGTNS